MLPVILGLALPQVSTIIGRSFASTLGEGAQSALMNANKLMQVPLGVFAQATAIAIYPVMTAQAARMKEAFGNNDAALARKEMSALRNSINYGVRSILFLTVPSSMLMCVLALPFVQLVFQSGKFTLADAETAATGCGGLRSVFRLVGALGHHARLLRHAGQQNADHYRDLRHDHFYSDEHPPQKPDGRLGSGAGHFDRRDHPYAGNAFPVAQTVTRSERRPDAAVVEPYPDRLHPQLAGLLAALRSPLASLFGARGPWRSEPCGPGTNDLPGRQ